MSNTAPGSDESPGPAPSAAVRWLATGFGAGYSPLAPGTVGALWGLPLTLLLAALPARPFLAIGVLVVLMVVAIRLADRAEAWLGSKDPRLIVIDEYVTLPVVCLWAPISVLYLAVGFLLHRVLDIFKPFPAGRSQKLGGGLGIVIDDVISSIYGAVAMVILHYAVRLSERLDPYFPNWLTATWW